MSEERKGLRALPRQEADALADALREGRPRRNAPAMSRGVQEARRT
jgi:hypothetical protein